MKTGERVEGPRRGLRFRIASSFSVAAFLYLAPFAPAAGAEGTRRVLVLYPVSDGQPGIILFDQNLRSTFKSSGRDKIEVYNEYLDAARFADDRYQAKFAGFLRQKYADRKIDLIIPGLAPSLDFVLKYREELLPDVPVIFGAIEQRELRARELGPGYAGVPMKVDLESTLGVALRLHPHTRRVAVVAGRSKTDLYWVSEARQAFRGYEGKVEFVYLTGLPMDDLLREVARLPRDSLIYYLHQFEDGLGETFVPAEVVDPLAAAANAPVYGHYHTYLGRGIVGGRMISFGAEGEKAARLALRVLAGEKPESIALPEAGEDPFEFDWRQLRRWGIGEDALPPGSVVLYKQPSFWDLYRWQIIGVIALCVVEALLIVGLLVQRASRRQAEERFRQVVAASPSGLVMIGADGRIVLANAQVEILFGYRQEELIGNPVEWLLPERFRDRHPADRDLYSASPTSRLMGAGRELFGRRKDGSEFPVEIGLNPIRAGARTFVLASIIDITERKRADEGLRESQREMRTLTGRLLQAQETERRRIARELHDDLNQGLALLAVQLDLLGQKPPAPGVPLGDVMRKLSDRVKQLSSAVHGLSTLLHPSKLEQLGLVAAVRSLCRELTQVHGLAIEFVDQPLPSAIPDDIALCLYRIAQEALQNAIKHGGARHARVELGGDEDGVSLQIVDDGAGFNPAAADVKGGLGLVGMRERLRLVGGAIAIDSRPAAGTRIDVHVPLGATARGPDDEPEGAPRSHPSGI